MKIKCSLTRAEATFVDEKRWSRCWSRCCLRCWLSVAWSADSGVVWWFDGIVRRLHPTLKRLDALASLRCQKCCIWRWGGQMHWRVFGFARGLHLTLRQSDALTGWRFCLLSDCRTASYWKCQKCYIQRWCRRMHWRFLFFFVFETQVRRFFRCLGYRCSGEILTDDMTQAGR